MTVCEEKCQVRSRQLHPTASWDTHPGGRPLPGRARGCPPRSMGSLPGRSHYACPGPSCPSPQEEVERDMDTGSMWHPPRQARGPRGSSRGPGRHPDRGRKSFLFYGCRCPAPAPWRGSGWRAFVAPHTRPLEQRSAPGPTFSLNREQASYCPLFSPRSRNCQWRPCSSTKLATLNSSACLLPAARPPPVRLPTRPSLQRA